MPGSAISGGGGGSQYSNGSRRAKTRQYHTVAYTSQVDESLFGTSKKDPAGGGNAARIERQALERSARRSGKKNKKETVQVVTKDLIRNLIIPDEDPSGHSKVLTYGDYLRIREQARVETEEEKVTAAAHNKMTKDHARDLAAERKQTIKKADMERVRNEKLNDLEEEERTKREYLKARANELRQEQEDEIKHLNELILNAKCHAIRDAQQVEKDQISREMVTEEKRLDSMMEVDRQNAIKVQEGIEEKRKQERMLGALQVMAQIQANEQEYLLGLEKKDQENRLQRKYLDKLCEEESDRLVKKREEQLILREELNNCNGEILQRKEQAKEQEKMLEKKVLEYQQQKAEREAAYEAEQERIRLDKEKDVARLRAQQERARDEQAERDALRSKRAQEQSERDWRRKEGVEAQKRAETEGMLKKARSKQMEQKEHFLAVQAQRERADFERVLRAQQGLIEKEKREEEEKRHGRTQFAQDIRHQIIEKEQERISKRQAFFEEGIKLDEEARQRRHRLDDIKRKKLAELREMGLGEKYLGQVARKAHVEIPSS